MQFFRVAVLFKIHYNQKTVAHNYNILLIRRYNNIPIMKL